MDATDALRTHLLRLLDWQDAHAGFDAAVEGLPPGLRGVRPEGLPHSPWQLLEHLRLTQRDVLEFCRDPEYAEPEWPADYWPRDAAPPSPAAWEESAAAFRSDREALQRLAEDPGLDLFARIPHGHGQTYLRELLLVADHNAYHLGQLILVRRLLGSWPAPGPARPEQPTHHPAREAHMSVERTREVMERYHRSEHSDVSMMADDVVFTVMATSQEHHGREGVRRMLRYFYHQAFDARAETRLTLYTEDHALFEADFVGTHIGEFAGIPATNRPVRVPLCVVYDLADGQITRGRVYFEMPVLLAQLAPAGERPGAAEPPMTVD